MLTIFALKQDDRYRRVKHIFTVAFVAFIMVALVLNLELSWLRSASYHFSALLSESSQIHNLHYSQKHLVIRNFSYCATSRS